MPLDHNERQSGRDGARWRQDFPIQSGEASYAARREFTKFLGLTSTAFVFGTLIAAGRSIWKRWAAASHAPRAVARVAEVDVGAYKLFRYPTDGDPCILLRLGPSAFAAFNQNCSHLACPVHFDTEAGHLLCPCHAGVFDASDGRPLAGPPRRGLDALRVDVRNGTIWVSDPGGAST